MAKAERLELRLDAALRAKLDELAAARGVSASVLVRRSILDAHRAAFPCAVKEGATKPFVREPPPEGHTLTRFHEQLWGCVPSDAQVKLYASHGRGYTNGVTEERIDAVVTTALHIAPVRPEDPVIILAPPADGALVLERVRAARAASKGKPFEGTIAATIQRMGLGIPTPWPGKELRVWVSVGALDGAPDWVRRRLVRAEP